MSDKTPRTERREILKGIGAAGMVGLAGCMGGDNGGDSNGDDGNGGGGGQPYYPHTIWGMYGSWEDAYVKGGEFYARDHDLDFENYNSRMQDNEQISHIQSFMQQNADGILVGPASATAPADQVEAAADEDVPVMACNSEIETDALTMSVYVGNEGACQEVAQELVDEIGGEGTVLNLQGDLSQSIGQERNQGFQNAVEGESGIDVIEVTADFQQEDAQTGTQSTLQSEEGDIDAIFAANGAMAAGAAEALDSYGTAPGEVLMGCMDGSPTVLGLFDDGWLQRAYAQPTQYYLPIAMYYMEDIRENGEDAIPEVGDEVTTDDLEITGGEHLGTDIWAGQAWAPATIEEAHGHPVFQTSGALLDEDNYDDESNWGVIFGAEAV